MQQLMTHKLSDFNLAKLRYQVLQRFLSSSAYQTCTPVSITFIVTKNLPPSSQGLCPHVLPRETTINLQDQVTTENRVGRSQGVSQFTVLLKTKLSAPCSFLADVCLVPISVLTYLHPNEVIAVVRLHQFLIHKSVQNLHLALPRKLSSVQAE